MAGPEAGTPQRGIPASVIRTGCRSTMNSITRAREAISLVPVHNSSGTIRPKGGRKQVQIP